MPRVDEGLDCWPLFCESEWMRFFQFVCWVIVGSVVVSAAEPEPKKQAPVDWGALFKIHWQNRVKAFKEQNLALQNVILLGDSITEGFEIAKYLPGRRILNRGIGADMIGNNMPADDPRGVLQRLDESVFDCAAKDVFILI